MSDGPTLTVENFAQIKKASITFGDLTVLVGPQATGKSLLLQWLKFAIDGGEVFHALKESGQDVKSIPAIIDGLFGEGMASAWNPGETKATYKNKILFEGDWKKGLKRPREGSVFFIPAHRALLLAEGWPAPFQKLGTDTPVVARLFSQNLYLRFSGRGEAALFPIEGNLKKQYREAIDRAVFHGGKVQLEKAGLRRRLRLAFGEMLLPYMTWTAGQREFTPLLLGLYHVLLPRSGRKRPNVDWVVIEEPEMGLHPEAITVVMLLVLDLLWRGYRVVVSTHSPLILEVLWAIQTLRASRARWHILRDAFGAQGSSLRAVMQTALRKEYRTFYLDLDGESDRVAAHDISKLDPDSTDTREADWGGLTRFNSNFGSAVRRAVNEAESK